MPLPQEADDSTSHRGLQKQLLALQQERDDLRLMLDMAIEHSDILLDALRQENHQLMLRLDRSAASGLGDVRPALTNPVEQFRLVADALPVGVMIARIVDGHVVYGNSAICQLLDISLDQLKNHKITDFCHTSADSQQLVAAMLNRQVLKRKLTWLGASGNVFAGTISLQPFIFKCEQTILTVIQSVVSLSQQ